MNKQILIIPHLNENKHTINLDYLKIFENSNIPYFISDYNIKNINIKNICGILLTGGGDISEKYLKEPLHKKASDICEKRDFFEIELLKIAFKNKIPTLGICRGAQIINIAFGGKINQHINGHIQTENRNKPTHFIKIKKDTNFYKIIKKDKIYVNSIHHQVISNIAPNFKKIAVSEDGYTEGIELVNTEQYFLGVQWHPEALFNEDSKKIFENFLKRVYNFYKY